MLRVLVGVCICLACILRVGYAAECRDVGQVLAAKQLWCEDNPSAGIRRVPFEEQIWDVQNVPPGARVFFGSSASERDATFEALCAAGIEVWQAASDSMPRDRVGLVGTCSFLWAEATVISTQYNPTMRTRAIACCVFNMDKPEHPCTIKDTDIYFAVDPEYMTLSGFIEDAYWSPNCASGCLDNVYDFRSAVVHEYGHALGLRDLDDFSWSSNAMRRRLRTNDTTGATPIACELQLVDKIYKDNFGPSVIDSFVAVGEGNTVVLRWGVRSERNCRRYSVGKRCENGGVYVVRDSVPCAGGGAYAVVDLAPCGGSTEYTLAVSDTVGVGVGREVLLSQIVYADEMEPRPVGLAMNVGVAVEPMSVGAQSPEMALELLGAAVTGRDGDAVNTLLGVGFMYVSLDRVEWGGRVERKLWGDVFERQTEGVAGAESLSFVVRENQQMGEGLTRVVADARYKRLVSGGIDEWHGRVAALVERRRETGLWRLRRIEELW